MTTLSNLTPNPTGYIFLDVDGILNPFDRKLGLDGWKLHKVAGFMIWAGTPLVPWFQDLVARGIQVVWATTWINQPEGLHEIEKLWGLPHNLPQIDKLERGSGKDQTSCGKRPGIIRWLTANKVDTHTTPVAWVDDDLGPIDLYWAEARGVIPVKPDSIDGLSDPKYIRKIEDALGLTVKA
jgi:hypothetical protein